MRKFCLLVQGLLIGLALACGGGHGSSSPAQAPAKQATGLAYVDPTGSTWRLVKDTTSTPTLLVLNLVGPAGLKSRGAGFNLEAPAGVHFHRFDETGFPLRDGGVYELLNTDTSGDPLEPVLLAGGVKPGNLLTVAVFQKDRRASAKDSGTTLFQIAIELDPSAHLHAGDALPLRITKAKYMAEDIGAFSVNPTYEMVAKAKLVDMPIAVGTLSAQ